MERTFVLALSRALTQNEVDALTAACQSRPLNVGVVIDATTATITVPNGPPGLIRRVAVSKLLEFGIETS